MRSGEKVQLRVTFTGSWSSGFEIADVVPGGYVVRRLSDGRLLPSPTSEADIRSEDDISDPQRPV